MYLQTNKMIDNRLNLTHVVIVQNPKSSHAKRSQKRISELQNLYGKTNVSVIKTTKDSKIYKRNLSEELQKYKGNVLLGIGGGDGTVHNVIEAILNDHKIDIKNIITLPLWGGNANDFGYMLNGLSVNKKIKNLIAKGKVVRIHPLQVTIKNASGLSKRYAVSYVSFGASAYAAHHLDKVSLSRKGRFQNVPVLLMLRESLQVLKALVQAPTFKAEIDGERFEIFEQAFTNGSRIAKINRMPVRINDKAFYRVFQSDKHPSIFVRMFKRLKGQPVGKVSDSSYEFTTKEPVLAQLDGEVCRIEAQSTVTIKLSSRTILALATKL